MKVTGKLSSGKLPPGRLPPTNPLRGLGLRLGLIVRVGGNLPEGGRVIFRGENFLVPSMNNKNSRFVTLFDLIIEKPSLFLKKIKTVTVKFR